MALLSKPTAAVTPVILAIILGREFRPHLRWLVLWLSMAATVLPVAWFVQPSGDVYRPPVWGRPIVALDAIAFYTGKLLVPFHFLIDYGRSPDWLMAHPSVWWAAGVAALGGLIVLAIRKPILHISAAIALAGILPVLGLVPFNFQYYSTVADRYVYLAMLGVAVARRRHCRGNSSSGLDSSRDHRHFPVPVIQSPDPHLAKHRFALRQHPGDKPRQRRGPPHSHV